MSTEPLLVIIVVAWVAIGLALSFLMGRRGYEPFSWFVLGSMLGPLAIALAVDAGRHRQREDMSLRHPGIGSTGTTDVVVGVDGSPESSAAILGVVELFGSALGRLTLVAVIPYDATPETERAAKDSLLRQAQDATPRELDMHVVRGKAAPDKHVHVALGASS